MRFVCEKGNGEAVLIEAADRTDATLWASRNGYSPNVTDAGAYAATARRRLREAFAAMGHDSKTAEAAAAGREDPLTAQPVVVPRQEAEILKPESGKKRTKPKERALVELRKTQPLSLEESFRALGLSEQAAKIAAGGRGEDLKVREGLR